MKVFQIHDRPNVLSFTNYERVSEEVLYSQVEENLKENPLVSYGKKISGPSEEIQEYRIDGYPFCLVNDFDYGIEIHSESQEAISKLLEYFEMV